MDIDEYLAGVRSLADDVNRQDGDPTIYINSLKRNAGLADRCADFRATTLTNQEFEKASAYFEIGYFNDAEPLKRAAWWILSFEILYALDRTQLERECERYRRDQPLFAGLPELFDWIRRREGGSPDNELINAGVVASVQGSEVYKLTRGYAKLSPSLQPSIPVWSQSTFGSAPSYLRLDPHGYFKAEPLQKLEEAALAPANPNWMSTLALFPREKTFGSYILQDCDPKERMDEYRDYHLRNIRRLEVSAQRRTGDYLSMMIEELTRPDDPNGIMIGHCIHFDTRAPIGTPIAKAFLQHLDLAINVYVDEDRALRFDDSLQNGKVRDASFRTHLYRVEGVPFPALFGFAERFLKSRVLLREWLTDAMGSEFAAAIASS